MGWLMVTLTNMEMGEFLEQEQDLAVVRWATTSLTYMYMNECVLGWLRVWQRIHTYEQWINKGRVSKKRLTRLLRSSSRSLFCQAELQGQYSINHTSAELAIGIASLSRVLYIVVRNRTFYTLQLLLAIHWDFYI